MLQLIESDLQWLRLSRAFLLRGPQAAAALNASPPDGGLFNLHHLSKEQENDPNKLMEIIQALTSDLTETFGQVPIIVIKEMVKAGRKRNTAAGPEQLQSALPCLTAPEVVQWGRKMGRTGSTSPRQNEPSR